MITNAEYRLTERCMADEGFDYPTPEAGLVVAKAVPFLSPDELRRSGYGFDWSAAARSFSSANDPNAQDPTAEMSLERAAAYQRALNGPVDGPTATLQDPSGDASSLPLEGCSADARVELFGSVLNAARFARADLAVSGEALSAALQDNGRYEQVKDLWQECMIGAGQDRDFVAPPMDYGFYILHSQMLVGVSSGAAGVTVDQEQAVAGDDADCQESSGLYEVREALLPQVRDRLYESIDVESAELDAFGRAVFERAKEIE